MPISRQEKEDLVQVYVDDLANSSAMFFARFSGMTVAQSERVRSAMAQENTRVTVIRNRLMAIAAEQAGRANVADSLDQATLAIFCLGDPTSPAKTLVAMRRDIPTLDVYGGFLGDAPLTAEQFQALAMLPSREELVGKFVYTLQAPISGFVGVLSGVVRSLMYVLQARADQLEGSTSTEAA